MVTTFEALAEPTRRQILDLLREKPLLVGDLADALNITQPNVSKHLRVLRDVGLVRVRRDAQRRRYELSPAPLAEIADWLEPYRNLLESRFERLDTLLDELKDEERKHGET